jgi:hypothetical protein
LTKVSRSSRRGSCCGRFDCGLFPLPESATGVIEIAYRLRQDCWGSVLRKLGMRADGTAVHFGRQMRVFSIARGADT